MPAFHKLLEKPGIIMADGPHGTYLQGNGLGPGEAPELWNVEKPDVIRTMYRSYVDAGAKLISTNTFGGTRFRLEKNGLEGRLRELNMAGVRLAKEAATGEALVMGDIGPMGELFEPLGVLTHEAAVEGFAEQAEALLAGGADLFLIETMSALEEVKAAIEGVKSVSSLPIIASMSFDTHRRTMMGVTPSQAVREIWPLGVEVFGANCGHSLDDNLEVIMEMRKAVPEAVIFAKPNAGVPHMEGDRAVYDVTPEDMAEYALRFAKAGIKIFSGCCGNTPAHIAAAARALKGEH